MLKIKQLYTLPKTIDPIIFSDGFNIILGEKSELSDKNNGVGKSLCIEFINFALLKKKSDSRVSLIPKEVFSPETFICLDLEIHEISYTIQRSIKESEQPTIIFNKKEHKFNKIEDATKYLTEKLFSNLSINYPSFRVMLGPLIRDEKSEFKSLINCYDTKLRVPENYTPHLYLFGINFDLYEKIKQNIKTIEEVSNDILRIEENVKLLRQKNIDDARSDLNELDSEVNSIENSINKLENLTGYEIVKNEIILLEEKIEALRRRETILKHNISKLKLVSQRADIDIIEISEFYEQIKNGLGSLISKDLAEVISFKERIDEFQNRLIKDRKDLLTKELSEIKNELCELDKKYSENLAVLDQKGELKNLKQTYAAFKEKTTQLSQLKSFVDKYDKLEYEKQKLKSEKEANLLQLQSEIQSKKFIIDDFQKNILNIHEYIQGNKQASFQIKHTNKKQVIEIVMRIDDDGSHSIEREKVFIYDISLLLNKYTQKNHPGFLIHDNILDVDQHTLKKNINFLESKANFGSTQYILTLNSDRLEIANIELLSSLDSYVRARFTKNRRFLKAKYQEL